MASGRVPGGGGADPSGTHVRMMTQPSRAEPQGAVVVSGQGVDSLDRGADG